MEDGTSDEYADEEPPAAVSEWLGRIAADRGVSEAELLQRLLSDGAVDGRSDEVVERLEALEDDLADADERVDELASSVDEIGEDVADKVEDVRDRIVQVKREADAKAPADHDHARYEAELEALRDELDSALDGLDALGDTVRALDDRVSTGFENFEEVVGYLTETTDELDESVDRANSGVNNLHRRVRTVEAKTTERAALADLLAEANRHGARSASCGACDESVELGLLTGPRCPHCRSGFTGFSPKRGFFGSHTLETGDHPALMGEVTDSPAPSIDDATPSEDGGPGSDPDRSRTDRDADVEVPGRSADPADEPMAGGETDEEADAAFDRGSVSEASPSLRDLEGVGPAFEERLRDAGIGSVHDLAAADPDSLAAGVDVSPERTERWIDRASGLVDD